MSLHVSGAVRAGSPVLPRARRRAEEAAELAPLPDGAREHVGADAFARVWAAAPQAAASLDRSYRHAARFLAPADARHVANAVRDAVLVADAALAAPGAESGRVARGLADTARAVAADVTAHAGARCARDLFRGFGAGMLLTVVYAAALGGLAVAGVWAFTGLVEGDARAMTAPEREALAAVLAAVAGGGLGAAISVLLRLDRRRALDYEQDVFRIALRRVVLGWLFATALAVLLLAGLTDILEMPDDGGTDRFFAAAAAGLVAGFNERFVGDLLHRGSPAATATPADSG